MIRLRYGSNPVPQSHTAYLTVEKVTICAYRIHGTDAAEGQLYYCLLYTSDAADE